jgi:hypothetical protein
MIRESRLSIDDLRPELKPIARAFVSLGVQRPHPTDEKWLVASGFVAEIRGHWLWVTAAHVLDELKVFVTKGDSRWMLKPICDPSFNVIHFNFLGAQKMTATAIAEELAKNVAPNPLPTQLASLLDADIGFVVLEDIYVKALRSSGVIPFSEQQTFVDPCLTAEDLEDKQVQYYVAGVPANSWRVAPLGRDVDIDFKALPVVPVTCESPVFEFEPQWPEGLHRGSIGGMSGGPIVSTGLERPYLVAVQSSQIIQGEKIKLLRATDAYPLLKTVAEIIDAGRGPLSS